MARTRRPVILTPRTALTLYIAVRRAGSWCANNVLDAQTMPRRPYRADTLYRRPASGVVVQVPTTRLRR